MSSEQASAATPAARPTTVGDVDWPAWQPTDRATLLFVRRGDSFLLIRKKRGLGAGKINAPGGRIEPGETAAQCAVRETEEEVCVKSGPIEHAGEHYFEFVDGYRLHVHVYVSHSHEGEPAETDEAVPMWVPVDQLPYDEMWADDRLWLPLLLAGRSFVGHYVFDDDAMLDYVIEVAGGETLRP